MLLLTHIFDGDLRNHTSRTQGLGRLGLCLVAQVAAVDGLVVLCVAHRLEQRGVRQDRLVPLLVLFARLLGRQLTAPVVLDDCGEGLGQPAINSLD